MKTIAAILLILLSSQVLAQQDPIRGRMICEVLANRFVPTHGDRSDTHVGQAEEYSPGATFIVDYTHDPATGLSIYMGEPDRANVLIEEPFPASSFKGVSSITNKAEYRTAFSEVSLGKYSVNYKGHDQLNIKRCKGDAWEGHFVRTYVSGQFTQVVSLTCHPYVNAMDDVLARLKLLN